MKFTEDETLQLVDLYADHECLWNLGSASYRNRNMRQAAEAEIVEKLGKNGFGVAEFKQKIKNLRCTYNQECLKIKKSMKSGQVRRMYTYIPNIKWFDAMDAIIKNAKGNKKCGGSVETNISQHTDSNEEEEEGTVDEPLSPSTPESQETPCRKKTAPQILSQNPPKAKRKKIDNLTEAVKQLQQVSQTIHEDENSSNEHEAFGNYVAVTLKHLRKKYALLAQHAIQGILLKYRLGNVSLPESEESTSKTQVYYKRPDSSDYNSQQSAHSSYSPGSSAYAPSIYETQNSATSSMFFENENPQEQQTSAIIERALINLTDDHVLHL